MANIAIITAAGQGRRMQAGVNKLFLKLKEESILLRTISIFEKIDIIDYIIVVVNNSDLEYTKDIILKKNFLKVKKIIQGGKERQDSVYNGLLSIEEANDSDIIIIHNGANPFVDKKTINDCIEATKIYGAAAAGFKARDTIKEVDENGFVIRTLDRTKLYQIQTPQCFKYKIGLDSFTKAFQDGFYATDDAAILERYGYKVKIVECPFENIKITIPNDLDFGITLLNTSRIGFGMDSHRFIANGDKKLVLGGAILDEVGFEANSDGDVILHALFNAISQALGEKSIGYYADKMCEAGITDSKEYLNVIIKIMKERGYQIGNVGIMLEGKRPKISKYHDEIKETLSKILNLSTDRIGITATSGEELTEFGKGLGMQCFVVVSLNKID